MTDRPNDIQEFTRKYQEKYLASSGWAKAKSGIFWVAPWRPRRPYFQHHEAVIAQRYIDAKVVAASVKVHTSYDAATEELVAKYGGVDNGD